jgi:GxxExxY protein
MIENNLSYAIRGAAFNVYNELGPGLLESVYEAALAFELEKDGYSVQKQKGLPVHYQGQTLDLGFRLDLLIENRIIVEIKSVETLLPVHHKQLLTYLRLTNHKLGLLINFNTDDLKHNIKRLVNNL